MAKTTEEIIKYLNMELGIVSKLHDQAKGNDNQAALFYQIKMNTFQQILEEIAND